MPSYFELCIKVNTLPRARRTRTRNHTHTHRQRILPWTASHCIWKAVITAKCEWYVNSLLRGGFLRGQGMDKWKGKLIIRTGRWRGELSAGRTHKSRIVWLLSSHPSAERSVCVLDQGEVKQQSNCLRRESAHLLHVFSPPRFLVLVQVH